MALAYNAFIIYPSGFLWGLIVLITVFAILFGKKPIRLNRIAWFILILAIPFFGVLSYWIFAR